MLINGQGQESFVEDLVLVMVDDDTLCVVVLRCKEAIHPAWREEPVVQPHWRVTNEAEVVVCIAIEALDHILIQMDHEWLIKNLDGDNNVLHRWYGVLLLDHTKGKMGVPQTVGITPARERHPVTGMIEAVL